MSQRGSLSVLETSQHVLTVHTLATKAHLECPKATIEALKSEHGDKWKKAGEYKISK